MKKNTIMKSISNTLVILTLIFTLSTAEVQAASKFGIKAGYQTHGGFKAGVFTGFNLFNIKGLSLQPELLFSQRKYSYSIPGWCGTLPITYIEGEKTVNMIEVPILFKYKLDLKGAFKPVIFAGPYVAFNIEEYRQYGFNSPYQTGVEDLRRIYDETDAGFIFGTGFEYGKGKTKFIMDVRFNLGLRVIQTVYRWLYNPQPNEGDFWNHQAKKNRSFSFLMGVSF